MFNFYGKRNRGLLGIYNSFKIFFIIFSVSHFCNSYLKVCDLPLPEPKTRAETMRLLPVRRDLLHPADARRQKLLSARACRPHPRVPSPEWFTARPMACRLLSRSSLSQVSNKKRTLKRIVLMGLPSSHLLITRNLR